MTDLSVEEHVERAGEVIRFRYLNERRGMVERSHPFEGIIPNMKRRYHETESSTVREELARYLSHQACPECGGARLNQAARHVTVAGRTLPDITALPVGGSREQFTAAQRDDAGDALLVLRLEAVPDDVRAERARRRPGDGILVHADRGREDARVGVGGRLLRLEREELHRAELVLAAEVDHLRPERLDVREVADRLQGDVERAQAGGDDLDRQAVVDLRLPDPDQVLRITPRPQAAATAN